MRSVAAPHAGRWLALVLAALVVLLQPASPRAAAKVPAGVVPASKKLIEFGWDEPDPRFMRAHTAQLLASPFDGCVFHADYHTASGDSGSFTWSLWGRRRFQSRDLDAARADLRATDFGRFTERFLRVNVTPGELDWFEPHAAVMANLELAARLARDGGGPGILFDIEPYRGKLWDFAVQSRVHPHTPARTWAALAAQVRRRGAEAMRALERGYPGLTVFLSLGYSWPLESTRGNVRVLDQTDCGLLAPFLDGMVAAASERVVLVDGHELSYSYREPTRFAAKADSMRRAARRFAADPDRYARRLSVAFGLWLDHDSGQSGWDVGDPSKNYFTPAVFGASLQAALDHADRYVWIYSQQPRWWSATGGPVRLPAVYDSVVRAVRR